MAEEFANSVPVGKMPRDESPPRLRATGLPPWVTRITTLTLWIMFLAVFFFFFNAISTVVLGVLAAAIVACTLHPLMRYIPGPRGVAAGVLGLSLIATVGALFLALSWPLAKPIQKAIDNWSQTETTVDEFLKAKSAKFGVNPAVSVSDLFKSVGNFLAGSGGQQLFSRSADVTLSILLWLVFIFVGSIFLLTESPSTLIGPASLLAPPEHRLEIHRMFMDLGPRLRRWVVATLLSMSIVFTASLIGYSIIGLKLAVPLALLAAVCEIVPTVGPAVAAVVAGLFAAATSTSGAVAGVAVVYGVIQSVEAYVILPMIMRGAVKIHPAVTLFSVVLWGKICGVPGLVLAIPINLFLWGIARHFIIRPPHMTDADGKIVDPGLAVEPARMLGGHRERAEAEEALHESSRT
jgi:predicted PurR-regulated permease PerM